jgi:hypothetical protein
MRWHLMDLTDFFIESQPPAFAVGGIVLDAHADRRRDAGEAEGRRAIDLVPYRPPLLQFTSK